MAIRAPQDLLNEELKDIYSAEKQLSRALPKLAKAASADSVRKLIDRRREEGGRIIEQIDQIFEQVESRPGRKRNAIAEGLIEEANTLVEEIENEQMLDAALIGALQKLEHYCIAAWGTAAAFAKGLEHPEAARTLSQLVEQGRRSDQAMTRLAEDEINPAMFMADEGDEEADAEEEAQPAARRAASRGGQQSVTRGGRRGSQPTH
jgi:ferritin-like metal-binding protein YciE